MSTFTRQTALAAALLAPLLAAGCSSTPAFSTRFPDNQTRPVGVFADRVSAPQPFVGTVAVGVSSEPSRLFGFDVNERKVLWEVPAQVDTAPLLAGPRVVTQEGSRVVGRDTRTGRSVFSLDAGDLHLNGADGDDRRTVITLSGGGGTFARGRVVFLVADAVAWERPVSSQVGVPALAGGTVVVPWSSQFITGLDTVTGEELARIRIRDGVISHAIASPAGVAVGSQYGYAVLDRSLGAGKFQAGRHLEAPTRELPGRPLFLRDAYDPEPALAAHSARHRIRLDWAPAIEPNAAGLTDDLVYLTFYRFVFALAAPDYSLRWVYTHDADIVGATAAQGGLSFADDKGGFGYLAAGSGQALWRSATNRTTSTVTLPPLATPAGSGAPLDASSIRQQLAAAVGDPDSRLVPIRVLALDMLAQDPSTEATAELLALCDQRKGAPMVRRRACDSLQNRATGGDLVRQTLERHFGYLEGTTAPPVGALAEAAAARGDRDVLPMLLEHLKDPHTAGGDLARLIEAIASLGQQAAVEPISTFLLMYHADPIDEAMVEALEASVKALIALGGEAAADTLGRVGSDPMTTFTLRGRAADGERTVLAKLDQDADKGEDGDASSTGSAAADDAAAKAADQKAADDDTPPERLTLAVVTKVFYPVRDALRACLDTPGKQLFRARVVLVVTDGELELVSVIPKAVEACVVPIVKAQTFPRTRYARRETITYTLTRR